MGGDLELFTENIQHAITSNEPDQNDVAIRDFIQVRQLGVRPQPGSFKNILLGDFVWGLPLKAAVTVMLIMERLKIFTLPFQM